LILVKARLRQICNELSLLATILSIRENPTASLEGFIPAEGVLKAAAHHCMFQRLSHIFQAGRFGAGLAGEHTLTWAWRACLCGTRDELHGGK
jgi:hypothetical protein